MRGIAALVPLLALGGGGGAVALLRPSLPSTVLAGGAVADPLPLAAAAGCYALALVASAGSWRGLLGLDHATAFACYATGSLANTILPARAGDALRLALFARRLPAGSRVREVAGTAATVGALRWTALALLALASTAARSSSCANAGVHELAA
jgi:hypothetical protein